MRLFDVFALAVFIAVFFSSAPVLAATGSYTFFPPEGCSSSEPRAMTWQSGDSATRCLSPQQLLKLALPDCKPGQVVTYNGNSFACIDARGVNAKAAK